MWSMAYTKTQRIQDKIDSVNDSIEYWTASIKRIREEIAEAKKYRAERIKELKFQQQIDEIAKPYNQLQGLFRELIDQGLTPKEACAVQNTDKTKKEIAEIMGVSCSRVTALERRGHRKLRNLVKFRWAMDRGIFPDNEQNRQWLAEMEQRAEERQRLRERYQYAKLD